MKNFIVRDIETGEVIRHGRASDIDLQAGSGEVVTEGIVADETPEEIEADNPKPPKIPFEKQPAYIINEQWQDVLNRINILEKK